MTSRDKIIVTVLAGIMVAGLVLFGLVALAAAVRIP